MQSTRAHGCILGSVGLYREEHDFLAGHFRHVLDETVPDLGVDCRVFGRCVRKNDVDMNLVIVVLAYLVFRWRRVLLVYLAQPPKRNHYHASILMMKLWLATRLAGL